MKEESYYFNNKKNLGWGEIRSFNRYFLHPKDQRLCNDCREIFSDIKKFFNIKKYQYSEKEPLICWHHCCKSCQSQRNILLIADKRKDPKTFIISKISSYKSRAKEVGCDFDLTPEYLFELWEKQNGLCFYTKEAISFENVSESGKHPHLQTPSLDRLDPNKGYVEGNVVWSSYCLNRMKNDLNYADFIEKCKMVLSLHN